MFFLIGGYFSKEGLYAVDVNRIVGKCVGNIETHFVRATTLQISSR